MTAAQDMIRGRSNVVTLTNNSGGPLVAGDVCVQDTSGNEYATTTTSAASTLKVFIAAESIASAATGKFYSAGYCPLVTPNASVTRGRYLYTHTVAKQAAENASYAAGAFGIVLTTGTTPTVWLFGATGQGAGGAGSDTSAIHNNVNAEINAITLKASPVSGDLLLIEDSAASNAKKRITVGSISSASAPTHAYFSQLCAMIEPLAIEAAQIGTFTYAINSSTTKYLLAGWSLKIGSGRFEIRDPRNPLPIRNATITGLEAGSMGAFIDPTLATYTDAWTTYYDRLNSIATSLYTKNVAVVAASTRYMLLPGPYGIIVTHVTSFNFAWVGLAQSFGTGVWPIDDEIGDTGASDYMRFSHSMFFPASKNMMSGVQSGQGGGTGTALGNVTYVICPATWGKVTDPNTYNFRDDFMGAALDTATKWTRTTAGGGYLEIDTAFQWMKIFGDGTWAHNGINSQTSIARANGKVFMADIYMDAVSFANTFYIGFSDGAGYNEANFANAIQISGGGSTVQVKENGNNRGTVGSGLSPKYIYRIRITLGASNNAVYEIQGGTQYAQLGGSTWTNITPGTSSSTTTPLYAGVTIQSNTDPVWIGDIKVY